MNFASKGCITRLLSVRFIQLSLEDNQVESMTLQERFPPERTSRLIIANALYHTCCYPLLRRILIAVLATRGVIIVSQTKGYGDISLKMAL